MNDGQVDLADRGGRRRCRRRSTGRWSSCSGLTYRHGVKELAYSRALPLIDGLRARGARVLAYDPLLTDDEIDASRRRAVAVGLHIARCRRDRHPDGRSAWLDLDPAWFPGLRVVYDGRNSLSPLVERLGPGVAYRGVGVPDDRRAPVAVD